MKTENLPDGKSGGRTALPCLQNPTVIQANNNRSGRLTNDQCEEHLGASDSTITKSLAHIVRPLPLTSHESQTIWFSLASAQFAVYFKEIPQLDIAAFLLK